MPRRLVLTVAAGGLLLAACGSGEDERPLPDIDPPAAAELPPLVDGEIDPDWIEVTGREAEIPRRALQGYAAAAVRLSEELEGCALAWNTLAGIGRVESIHGQINGSAIDEGGVARPDIRGIPLDGGPGVRAIPDTDGGRLDGDTEWDRAVGPMQFIPTTWEQWGADGNEDGGRNPQNIDDAALAAGRYLCDAGGELDGQRGWLTAVLTYNNSSAYAREVAGHANEYAEAAP